MPIPDSALRRLTGLSDNENRSVEGTEAVSLRGGICSSSSKRHLSEAVRFRGHPDEECGKASVSPILFRAAEETMHEAKDSDQRSVWDLPRSREARALWPGGGRYPLCPLAYRDAIGLAYSRSECWLPRHGVKVSDSHIRMVIDKRAARRLTTRGPLSPRRFSVIRHREDS